MNEKYQNQGPVGATAPAYGECPPSMPQREPRARVLLFEAADRLERQARGLRLLAGAVTEDALRWDAQGDLIEAAKAIAGAI